VYVLIPIAPTPCLVLFLFLLLLLLLLLLRCAGINGSLAADTGGGEALERRGVSREYTPCVWMFCETPCSRCKCVRERVRIETGTHPLQIVPTSTLPSNSSQCTQSPHSVTALTRTPCCTDSEPAVLLGRATVSHCHWQGSHR
jgi:hypothetical protein